MTKNGVRLIWHGSIFMGAIMTVWASAALLSGLAEANWQFSELLRQYLIAVGVMKEFHTLSDFYTHIKGIEYIIAVSFLGAFPAFYAYLNRAPQEVAANQ